MNASSEYQCRPKYLISHIQISKRVSHEISKSIGSRGSVDINGRVYIACSPRNIAKSSRNQIILSWLVKRNRWRGLFSFAPRSSTFNWFVTALRAIWGYQKLGFCDFYFQKGRQPLLRFLVGFKIFLNQIVFKTTGLWRTIGPNYIESIFMSSMKFQKI